MIDDIFTMLERLADTIHNCLFESRLFEVLEHLVRCVNRQFSSILAKASIAESEVMDNKNFLKMLIRINEMDALISIELPNFK